MHREGFAGSNKRLQGDFAAIITAEDVGAYKPAENHFRALDNTLPRLGVERGRLLHVAQSLSHDHVPAKREGLPSVWINRRHDRPGWGATPEPGESWTYNLEFNSMGDFLTEMIFKLFRWLGGRLRSQKVAQRTLAFAPVSACREPSR